MRHLAITGMETAAMISRIFLGLAMRATPPSARICAGTRSKAMTETAPAFSAMTACSALVTSMMTPPLSISARPVLRRRLVLLPLFWDMMSTLWIPFRDREGWAVRGGRRSASILQCVAGSRYPLSILERTQSQNPHPLSQRTRKKDGAPGYRGCLLLQEGLDGVRQVE